MVRRNSKRIVWKKPPAEQVTEVKRLPPIVRVVPRDDELVLVPGQLFRLMCPMEIVQENPRFQKPAVPYATTSYYGQALPANSLAVFLGHTRVEEMDGTHVRSLLKPTFMVNGTKMIPSNLNFLEPVT
jgi:hypothetical protein